MDAHVRKKCGVLMERKRLLPGVWERGGGGGVGQTASSELQVELTISR